MDHTPLPRTPAGIPTGGQFREHDRAEPMFTLDEVGPAIDADDAAAILSHLEHLTHEAREAVIAAELRDLFPAAVEAEFVFDQVCASTNLVQLYDAEGGELVPAGEMDSTSPAIARVDDHAARLPQARTREPFRLTVRAAAHRGVMTHTATGSASDVIERAQQFELAYPERPSHIRIDADVAEFGRSSSLSGVHDQVAARAGRMEIDSVAAVRIAAEYPENLTLAAFARGEEVSLGMLYAESTVEYAGIYSSRQQERLSALMTYCIYGPNVDHGDRLTAN